jgi:hypothetical protein
VELETELRELLTQVAVAAVAVDLVVQDQVDQD